MPVYSNTRCCVRVHREHAHASRAHSASSCAPTCEQRDACRKKRCVDATTRANFSRSTRRYTRDRYGRHMRIDVLNVSTTLLTCISNTVDARRAKSMRLRWSTACLQYRKSRAAHPMREVLATGSRHRCVRERESHRCMRCWCRCMPPRRDLTMPNCERVRPCDRDMRCAKPLPDRGKTLLSNR